MKSREVKKMDIDPTAVEQMAREYKTALIFAAFPLFFYCLPVFSGEKDNNRTQGRKKRAGQQHV